MTDQTVTHAAFTLERVYDAAPSRVFHAFTDHDARQRWFFKSDSWALHDHTDGGAAVGARESSRFSPPGSDAQITNDSVYLDIVPNERLIFAYAMTIDGKPISASLATAEFRAEGQGTRLIFTEQGAYLDGPGETGVEGREEGTRLMLEDLGREIDRQTA